MASTEVTGEFLVAKHDEYCAVRVGNERHSGFDEGIGACLESPCFRFGWWSCSGLDTFIGGKECNHRLSVFECLDEDIADVRARIAARADKLIPLFRVEAK